MFEVNGNSYELKYNIKRLDMIEQALGEGIISVFQSGAPTLRQTKTIVAYALKPEGGNAYVSPMQGMDMAEKLIEENGYSSVIEAATDKLMEDCGFLFRSA